MPPIKKNFSKKQTQQECKQMRLPIALLKKLPVFFDKYINYLSQYPGGQFRKNLAEKFCLKNNIGSDEAIKFATFCEWIHTASLVHDDLQDRDLHRRGQKSFWNMFGEYAAVSFGDMIFSSTSYFIDEFKISDEKKWLITKEIQSELIRAVSGQEFEKHIKENFKSDDIWNEYETLSALKTGSILKFTLLGPILMTNRHQEYFCQELTKYCNKLGVLFQMADDLKDFRGLKEGRNAGEDLFEGKFSALICLLIQEKETLPLEFSEWSNYEGRNVPMNTACALSRYLVEHSFDEKLKARIIRLEDELSKEAVIFKKFNFDVEIKSFLNRIILKVDKKGDSLW